VVVGAEVFVNGRFKKPEGMVGPYMIVAVEGAEFAPNAANGDRDLVAVDLSASGVRALPEKGFSMCNQLAAVAFPRELESIGKRCFSACDALHVVDLADTQLRKLGEFAFAWSGVGRVTVPASLREMVECAFADTPLKVLDLSACAGIRVRLQVGPQPMELSLPREGFGEAARAFMPFAVLEVLRADVDDGDIIELLPSLCGWDGVDKLRVISPRVDVFEWQRPHQSVLVELTDPVTVKAPAAVTMTAWRRIPPEWNTVLRVLDLSGMVLDLLPVGASCKRCHWLERAVLPTGLRVLPEDFFRGCIRLKSIVTGSTALEEIGVNACARCTTLAEFPFPSTIRRVGDAFRGTSITTIDLSDTEAESVSISGMVFLAELILPRQCVLSGVYGMPSLRRVTFGASRGDGCFAWHPTEVRFEGVAADAGFSPGLLGTRVYAEVACELGRETVPLPPP
jgi:hypothetical protein